MEKEITVMVTGVGGGGIGEQIIKALRLSENQYKIVGTDATDLSKGLMNVDIPVVVPLANHTGYIEQLLSLCKKHDIKVIFPGSEPELLRIGKERELFEQAGVLLPINTNEVLDICLDKNKTIEFLKENGFAYPMSKMVTEEEDLKYIDFLPAVLKPSIGGSGSANIMIAQTKEEIEVFGKYLLTIYPEFIVQEYVGTPQHEYTVGVLFSMQGEFINSIGIRRNISGLGSKIKIKNRSNNKNLGEHLVISSGISQGEVGNFPEVTLECKKIALSLGARSALNIQCRYHQNKIYVFEINPRYSGTTSLRAMCGFNEPDIIIRKSLLKENVEPNFQFRHAFILRGLSEQIISREL